MDQSKPTSGSFVVPSSKIWLELRAQQIRISLQQPASRDSNFLKSLAAVCACVLHRLLPRNLKLDQPRYLLQDGSCLRRGAPQLNDPPRKPSEQSFPSARPADSRSKGAVTTPTAAKTTPAGAPKIQNAKTEEEYVTLPSLRRREPPDRDSSRPNIRGKQGPS
jgi:hypothetical protein